MINRLNETFVAATTVAMATDVSTRGWAEGGLGANQGLLERETERLQKAVAELTLDKQIVEEAV